MSAVFRVPEAKAKVETFTFEVPRPSVLGVKRSPEQFTIPLTQHITSELREGLNRTVTGVTTETLDEEQAQRIWDAQLLVLEHYAPGVAGRLTNDQLSALFGAWYEASNISLGESSASSSS